MRELKNILFCVDVFVHTKYRVAQWTLTPGTEEHFSIPVRLSQKAGYVRDWCGRPAGLQTLVSARRVEHGEPPQTINGVLLAIYDDAAELQRLAKLNKISIGLFEPLGWQPLPDVPFVYIFTPFKLEPVNVHFPILQSSLDTCLKGFLEYGQDFAVEFLDTTIGWSKFWINERNIPRRPWIHEEQYKLLDDLLAEYPRQSNTFSERRLASEYAEHFVKAAWGAAIDQQKPSISQGTVCTGGLRKKDTQFVFGYGSLINSISRYQTNPKSKDAVPVQVSADFGFLRAWNFHGGFSKLTALGVRRPLEGESAHDINGVVYPVDGTDMAAVDEREDGYNRVEIPWAYVRQLSWKSLPDPAACTLWMYVPDDPEPPTGAYPVLQTYLDVCITGCLEFGEDFAEAFLESTFDWNRFWIDDRVMARRPWIHCPNHREIDELLSSFPSKGNAFHHRKLAEEYAVNFVNLGATHSE